MTLYLPRKASVLVGALRPTSRDLWLATGLATLGDMAEFFDAVEREQLSNLLDELGPQAPTLLEPWTPVISPRTWCSVSTATLPAPGLSCPVRGAVWPNGDGEPSRSRTLPGSPRRSDRDPRQASSASGGRAGVPISTSSSFTRRTCAEPTVAAPEPTSTQWTRPCGAMSRRRPGFSPAGCTAQDSSFTGQEPATLSEHGEENRPPASPDLRAKCCYTCSADRAQRRSR